MPDLVGQRRVRYDPSEPEIACNGCRGCRVEASYPCYMVEGVKVAHVYLNWPDNPEKKERVWWRHWAGGRSVDGLPDGILPADLYYMTGDLEGAEAVIVEDERCAEAVEMAARPLRVIATASGRKVVPLERVLAHCLRGVSRVTLWPDNDEGVLAHMKAVAARIGGA